MFGVDSTELIIVAIAALLFIGPKELPQTMRMVGRWVGKVRGMARHFTSGIESVIREAELEEMERKWREENDRIMRDYPALDAPVVVADSPSDAQALPVPEGPSSDPAELPSEQRELP
ncbi:MAG: Sec-independent protein translocase protein TatB [Sphingomicrobium sp.]